MSMPPRSRLAASARPHGPRPARARALDRSSIATSARSTGCIPARSSRRRTRRPHARPAGRRTAPLPDPRCRPIWPPMRIVAGARGAADRIEHPQEEPGRDRSPGRPLFRRSSPERCAGAPRPRFRPPTISVDDWAQRRTQPSIGAKPGPRPSSPAIPAVSGVSAQPFAQVPVGRRELCQSMTFGRTPPISSGYASGQRYSVGLADGRTSARSLLSGSATNQTGARPPPFQYFTSSSHSCFGGAATRRQPVAGGRPSTDRPPQVEVLRAGASPAPACCRPARRQVDWPCPPASEKPAPPSAPY